MRPEPGTVAVTERAVRPPSCMFPDPARVALSRATVPETVSSPLPGSSAVNVRAVTPFSGDRSAAYQSGGGEGWHGYLDAQREVGGEASALGHDEDTVPDVGRDAVDQVVVGVDDDGLARPYVNGDAAATRQIDGPERWDGSRLGSGDA